MRACCSRLPSPASDAVYGAHGSVPATFDELRERPEIPRAESSTEQSAPAHLCGIVWPFEKWREVAVLFLISMYHHHLTNAMI